MTLLRIRVADGTIHVESPSERIGRAVAARIAAALIRRSEIMRVTMTVRE